MFIGASCPDLSAEAYRLAALTIKQDTMDTKLYQTAYEKYTEARKRTAAAGQQSAEETLDPASEWLTSTRKAAQKEHDKLEAELKSYQSNLIKESIRVGSPTLSLKTSFNGAAPFLRHSSCSPFLSEQMAYRDLGNFERKVGDLQAATRYHSKVREYSTLPSHVIDMCLALIELALELGNFTSVRNSVAKAQAAIDSAGSGSLSSSGASSSAAGKQSRAVNLPGMVAPQATRQEQAQEKEKQMLLDKLTLALGLADLAQGHYARAARHFTKLNNVGVRAIAEAGHLDVAPGDIAMYAVLCGLASFERSAVKSHLLENSNLRSLLETEPHLKAILSTFYESKYADTLELLHKHGARHLLDVHLSHHVEGLVNSIRDKAVVAFTRPFTSVSLARMAASFGWTEEETKEHAIRLIQNGSLAARIDTKRGVLKSHEVDPRRDLFHHALSVGEELEQATRKVQLRVKLLQHDLIVKDPHKSRHQQGQAQRGGGSSVPNPDAIETD